MKYYSKTHKGNIRKQNEDSILADGYYAVVADGMGGHNAGDVASSLIIKFLVGYFKNKKGSEVTTKEIKKAILEANKEVWFNARLFPERKGMGSTITLAVFKDQKAFIGQVGDSRAYLYTDGSLKQITKDHSYVQELIDSGQITESEALYHPKRNIITRAVGTNIDIEPDLFVIDMKPADALLLCSDGLISCMSDEKIASIIKDDIKSAADRLVDAALDCGGEDNISVIIAAAEGSES